MLPILNLTGPRLEVNALFLQPTFDCTLNCKGCYVKAHPQLGEQVGYIELSSLINHFYQGVIAWANQISISLDNFPKANSDHVVTKEGLLRNYMLSLHQLAMFTISDNYRQEVVPEIHVTIHSDKVYQEYRNLWDASTNWSYSYPTVVSLSNILDLDYVKKLTQKTQVNYNHTCPTGMTSFNIDSQVEKLVEIGRVVNSIYLILFKSPVGGQRDNIVEFNDSNRMRSDISYIKAVLDRLPQDVRSKVHTDGCLQDVLSNRKTGFGCSSNISRFQVWPDGSVSGCAYACSSNTGPGRTATDIMENIRKARSSYDFRRCHLPKVYDSITK